MTPDPDDPTTGSLESIAAAATAMFASSPGFVGCTVLSRDPPILEFELTNEEAAQRFKAHLEAQSTGFRHQFDPNNPAVVLQFR